MTRNLKLAITISVAATALMAGVSAHAQTQATADTHRRGAEMTRESATQQAEHMFARMDANADGKIDSADQAKRAENRFDRIDADGNGTIDRSEFAAMAERRGAGRTEGRRGADRAEHRSEHRGERRAENGGDVRPAGMRRGRGPMGNGGRMITAADTNSDGAVTAAEFTTAMLARFDAADANDDGTVSREERRAARPDAHPEAGRAQSRAIR